MNNSIASRQNDQRDSLVEGVVFLAYLGLILWLPLSRGGARPMYWFVMEVWVLSLAIAIVFQFLTGRAQTSDALRQAKSVILCFICVAAWIGIQGFDLGLASISIDPHATQVQFIKSVCYTLLFCITAQIVNTRAKLEWLAIVLVASGTLQAIIAISNNGNGLFVNRNHLAGYLEMALPIGIGLIIAQMHQTSASGWRENLRRWIAALLGQKARVRVCLVIMVIGLIVSRSRMGNAAFVTSMMVSGAIGLILYRRSSRGVLALFTSMIIIDIMLMGTFFGIDQLQQRFEETRFVGDQRILLHELTLTMIRDNWLMGSGAGTFYTHFPQYRDDTIVPFNEHAEGDLFELPAELGVIGVIPLALIVVLSFVASIRVQITRHSPFCKAMGFPAMMAIIAIMMHSWADFNLQMTTNAATFIVLLAFPYIALTIERRRIRGGREMIPVPDE